MSQEEGDRLRKRFNVLARKAEAFFKEAGGESWNARRIADQKWALLSVEQRASADRIRLLFESFRGNNVGHLACEVFREAYDEARELLELLSRQGPWQPPAPMRGPFSKSRK